MGLELETEGRLHTIRGLISTYAEAKAARVELEEYRKVCKAQLMKKAQLAGVKALAAQEREAYADSDYAQVIKALAEATKQEAGALWALRLEEWRFEAWRTEQANQRMERQRYG